MSAEPVTSQIYKFTVSPDFTSSHWPTLQLSPWSFWCDPSSVFCRPKAGDRVKPASHLLAKAHQMQPQLLKCRTQRQRQTKTILTHKDSQSTKTENLRGALVVVCSNDNGSIDYACIPSTVTSSWVGPIPPLVKTNVYRLEKPCTSLAISSTLSATTDTCHAMQQRFHKSQ